MTVLGAVTVLGISLPHCPIVRTGLILLIPSPTPSHQTY
jgi:hypothetical protein